MEKEQDDRCGQANRAGVRNCNNDQRRCGLDQVLAM